MLIRTLAGAILVKCSINFWVISSGFWPGTKRMLIFAKAFDGITVLAPSPIYPPHIPFTSKVGRIEVRSGVVYPYSPFSAGIAIEALN